MAEIPGAYRSHTVEQALAHLAEELAEATQATAKSIRFGLNSVNPEDDQGTNIDWIRREMRDVVRAYLAFAELIGHKEELEYDLRTAVNDGART